MDDIKGKVKKAIEESMIRTKEKVINDIIPLIDKEMDEYQSNLSRITDEVMKAAVEEAGGFVNEEELRLFLKGFTDDNPQIFSMVAIREDIIRETGEFIDYTFKSGMSDEAISNILEIIQNHECEEDLNILIQSLMESMEMFGSKVAFIRAKYNILGCFEITKERDSGIFEQMIREVLNSILSKPPIVSN